MKRMSVKLKITLWYTLVITVLSIAVLTAMTSVNSEIIERDIESRIARTVDGFSRRTVPPENKGGKIPEFGFYEQGVHMIMYDSDGNVIAGRVPFEIEDSGALEDRNLEKYSDGKSRYYIYTRKANSPSGEIWIKGIVSVNDESFAMKSAIKANILLTLMLIIIAAGGGYFILSRALAPVNKISRTAKKIIESSDLSQRIRIGDGKDEIHELANTFDDMLDRIEQTLEREKQFTSDASHELRTPVAVILSECEYLIDCADNIDDAKTSAESVKKQAENMSKLISELLTISRMDKNTIKTSFEDVDLSELLGFVCDEQEEIHSESITLTRDIGENIHAEADRFLLARLAINLISNAYTYGKSSGNIRVSLHESGGDVVLEVADDGIGISEENLPKIWERFFRADEARTANDEGNMGLGLSMVKWIAECHGGSISAESTLGKGSVFRLIMPKKR